MSAATFDPAKVDEFIERWGTDQSALIQVLQDVQEEYRYLPKEALVYVSEKLRVPLAKTYNVATFYNAFSLNPIGRRHVCVCMGTACHVRGSTMVLDSLSAHLGIKPGETTKDGEFTLDTVNCLGACSLAPVVVINDDVYAQTSAANARKLVLAPKKKAAKSEAAAAETDDAEDAN